MKASEKYAGMIAAAEASGNPYQWDALKQHTESAAMMPVLPSQQQVIELYKLAYREWDDAQRNRTQAHKQAHNADMNHFEAQHWDKRVTVVAELEKTKTKTAAALDTVNDRYHKALAALAEARQDALNAGVSGGTLAAINESQRA